MYPIDIIGIGQGREDLTQKHLDIIKACDVLVGGKRHLEMFDCPDKQKITVKADMNSVIEAIKDKMNRHKIAVLASGDPLFYGIGSTLTRHFDKQYLTVHSNVSSIAAAFAAIKEPWHDAKIISLHDKQKAFFSFGSLACEQKVAFLTNPQMNPQYIAAGLMKYNLHDFRFCVIEKLGDKDEEKITWIDNIDQVKNHTFLQPNIVILKKQEQETNHVSHETHIGMTDFAFKHSNGLITKSEIRSITLSKLKLTRKDHVLWDIGAGSGSVGIEASLQIPLGRVYAVEKHPGRICDIAHNIKKFNCSNVQIMNTAFPEGMEELTRPDRIFIGGGGQGLEQIITVSAGKLAAFGIIVVNTVLLQNMEIALRLLKEKNFDPDVVQIQVSRSKIMPFGDRLEALNPVWIISGSKPEIR